MTRLMGGAALVVLLWPVAAQAWWWHRHETRTAAYYYPVSVAYTPVAVYPVAVAPVVPLAAAPACPPAVPSPAPAPPNYIPPAASVPAVPNYAQPSAAPPSAAPAPYPPAAPGAPRSGATGSRALKPVDSAGLYFDTYVVALPENAGYIPRDQLPVCFWNRSNHEVRLKINGQTQLVAAGQRVELVLGKSFVWQVDGREPQAGQIPDSGAGLDVVIRR